MSPISGLLLASLLALPMTGCGDDAPAPDAAVDAPVACGPFAELASLSASAGGRVAISRTAGLSDPALTFEPSAGLTAVAEPARLLLYAAYDAPGAGTLRVVCAGGASTEVPVTVRPLAWSLVSAWDPAVEGPPAREYGAWWIGDDAGGAPGLYVFGGFHYVPVQFTPAWDLWRFDLGTSAWSAELPTAMPPMAPGGRAAAGAMPGTIVYHGGSVRAADGSLDTPPTLTTLGYGAEPRAWTDAPFASTAPGSYTGAFLRDERRDRWLSVCGVDSRRLGIHCRVHEYRESTGWQQVFVAEGPVPPGRYGFHYAYDEETDRVILAAGQTGPENLEIGGDTWALELGEDPPRWVELVPDHDDIRRRNGAFVLDPEGRRLLLWGGTADGADSVPGLYALGVDRGRERWDVVDLPAEVPSRTSGIGAYDAPGRRALFGFGNDDDLYTDLWALAL